MNRRELIVGTTIAMAANLPLVEKLCDTTLLVDEVCDSLVGEDCAEAFLTDSTGAFLIGELEGFGRHFHGGPLVTVSWKT